MAAVTVATGWPRTNVIGNMRQKMAKVTVTNNGDTWVTGLTVIKSCSAQGSSGTKLIGATVSGGTVTFVTDGTADAAVFVTVVGF
jgi:hypothetical protein